MDKEKIHWEFNQNYELALKAVEEKYKAQLKAKENEIIIYRQTNADMQEITKLLAGRPINVENKQEMHQGPQYNQSGQFGIGHMSGGEIKEGAEVTGVRNEAQQQNLKDLEEAVSEVQSLLAKHSQTYPNNMPLQAAKTIEEIENRPSLKQKLIGAAQQAGIKAIEKTLDNPAGAIITGAIEGWINAGTK